MEVPGLSSIAAVVGGQGSLAHGAGDGGYGIALTGVGTVVGLGSNAHGALGIVPVNPWDPDGLYAPVAGLLSRSRRVRRG